MKFIGTKNVVESLIIALSEWFLIQEVKTLNKKIKRKPLKFIEGFGTEFIRKQRDLK